MDDDDDQFDQEIDGDDFDDDWIDDDPNFFPIDVPTARPLLSSSSIRTTISDNIFQSTEPKSDSSEQSVQRLSTGAGASSSYPKNTNSSFVVLTQEEISKYMLECIKEVKEVIKLPSTTIRLLLHHLHWDKERLTEQFFDSDRRDELFRQAHIVNPFKKPPAVNGAGGMQRQSSMSSLRSVRRQTSTSITPSPLSMTPSPLPITPSSSIFLTTTNPLKEIVQQTCEICCSTKPSNEMAGLKCDHIFCIECWQYYLTMKIMHEGSSQTISCPAKCNIRVDDVTVLRLIESPEVRRKYQHLITNSFVECNRKMRWCPGNNCTNAIKSSSSDITMVTCTCSTSFCFQCGETWHEPVKCIWLKKWQKKCHDDSETSNWIAANTKDCPKCHVMIEKNGGCNHMTCRNQSCKYEFCWLCLGEWSAHGSSFYSCNRFNEDDAKKARDEQERARAALKRYLHFYNRYRNHHESLRLEGKLLEQVQKQMEIMQERMGWIEVQFLQTACEVLRQCRQTLMYTYPFAFYLKKNNHSEIFEDNQADLEHATEELSGYLERDFTEINDLADMRRKVQDKCRYCEHRRQVLLKHVTEGYNDGYWEFDENI